MYEKATGQFGRPGWASGENLVLSGNRLYEEYADFEETCQTRGAYHDKQLRST